MMVINHRAQTESVIKWALADFANVSLFGAHLIKLLHGYSIAFQKVARPTNSVAASSHVSRLYFPGGDWIVAPERSLLGRSSGHWLIFHMKLCHQLV
jgi:hypothetical protein